MIIRNYLKICKNINNNEKTSIIIEKTGENDSQSDVERFPQGDRTSDVERFPQVDRTSK